MRIALVGYGKMGQQIHELLKDGSEHEVVSIACREVGDELSADQLRDVDVAIDFSAGELIKQHVDLYCQNGVSAVIGTTGWDKNDSQIINQIEAASIGVVVGSNFSAGVQIFLQLVSQAAKQLYDAGNYDVYGLEIHHRHKVDSPSGTAKTIVEAIQNNFPSKKQVDFDRVEGAITPDTLHFSSVRGGESRGYHQVVFDSQADEISLVHTAHSRQGFASGAIMAAQWVEGRTGYFEYESLFNKELNDNES